MKHLLILLFIGLNATYAQIEENLVEEKVYDFAETEPEYPGGEEAMVTFIQENIVYPEQARQLGEQGIVYVQFIVEKDGSLSNIKVIRGVSELLDAEAMRVLEIMPNWKPATQNGDPVRVRYTLPIHFRLSDKKEEKKKKRKKKKG